MERFLNFHLYYCPISKLNNESFCVQNLYYCVSKIICIILNVTKNGYCYNHLPTRRCYIALRRLRATNQIEEDIEEMRAEERAQQSEATISMMELLCSPTLRQPLVIAVVMQLSQQLSGINAVSSYSLTFSYIAVLNYTVISHERISKIFVQIPKAHLTPINTT